MAKLWSNEVDMKVRSSMLLKYEFTYEDKRLFKKKRSL
jgi:hypothetical protein